MPLTITLSVDCRQKLRAECIQPVINPNIESDDDGSNFEEDVDDAVEINSKPAVNSGKALAMLDNLQLFFEENHAGNKVLRSIVSLTKKSRKSESNQRKKNYQ